MSGRFLLFLPSGLLAALAAVGCRMSEPTGGPVTEGQALVLLQQAVHFVQAGDVAGVCQVSGRERCLRDSEWVDPRQVGEPSVIGFREMPRSRGSQDGGYLETCTKVGGQRVYSEFFVVREDGELVAPYPAYWYPRRYSGSNADGVNEAVAIPGQTPGDPRCAALP